MAETNVESLAEKAGVRTNVGLLQRLDWVRGYLLMTPTILLMCGLLIAPLASLFLRSFWTQHGFEIDKTFTLHNYWDLIAPSDQVTWWSGIPFPLKNPAYAIVIIKSLLISLGYVLRLQRTTRLD